MKDKNLVASVALFSELYNNEKEVHILDILAEFIKGAVVSENKWSVTITELISLLEKVYGFKKIPDSVIKTTLKNRLKDIVTNSNNGYWNFNTSIKSDFEKIDKEFQTILNKQNSIINGLKYFVQKKITRELSDDESKLLIENLNNYLLDNSYSEKYSRYISAFIVSNQDRPEFIENLNLIREGIVLYQGIRYTANINELGKWNDELTIYLSTEHLFNAVGYNGLLYKEIFEDFYQLVTEINYSNKDKSTGSIIKLKYFEETKHEIDTFFQTADQILRGKVTLDPSKPAMVSILEGCSLPKDLVTKRTKFDSELTKKGILYETNTQSIYTHAEYVVEDSSILQELKEDSERKGRNFDENTSALFLKIFTKVNSLRKGQSNLKFEKIRYIFMTENRFALYLAHNNSVKFEDHDIPFAKDMDFITNKFWFKLKKGFSDSTKVPTSFDVVTKAQIILSSHINQSVYQEYTNLQQQLNEGRLDKEEAAEIYLNLKEKTNKPEEVTINNLDKSLDFLSNETFFADFYREKQQKEKYLSQLQTELDEFKAEKAAREKAESERTLEEKRNNYRIEKNIYVEDKMKNFIKEQNYNLLYFLGVTFLTVLPVFIGFYLKANKELSKWIEELGDKQYFIWGGLSLVLLLEILGRSYLFNKDKVKSGWIWLKLIFLYIERENLKDTKRNDIEMEYDNLNNIDL
ncbi:hypothetical protein GOQ04_17220 [Emticicia sp. ODNR4P]|nr:hypothetical protein [Emticicia sp. ODNR4P]